MKRGGGPLPRLGREVPIPLLGSYLVPGLMPATWISLVTWTVGLVALVTGRHR
jgi:hypothetical protein